MTFVNNNGKVPYIMVAGADHVSGEMPIAAAEQIYNKGKKRASNRFPGLCGREVFLRYGEDHFP